LDRKIYVHTDIDNASFAKFSRRLSRIETETEEPIYIEIMSDGGNAYSALAYFDRIKESPNEIVTIAYGLVASAATIIFAAGDRRIMMPSAHLMVHEDEADISDVRVSELEAHTKHMRYMEDFWNKILGSVTNTNKEQWDVLHLTDKYLSAPECLGLGLCDEIFQPKKIRGLL